MSAFADWYLDQQKTKSSIAAKNREGDTTYAGLPDYHDWNEFEMNNGTPVIPAKVWRCQQYQEWYLAMESRWGTAAARVKFMACWTIKPNSVQPELQCGLKPDFIAFFAARNIDVANPLYTAKQYLQSAENIAASVTKNIAPIAYIGAIGAIAYYGYKVANNIYDLQVKKQAVNVTPMQIAKGATIAVLCYPVVSAFLYKNVTTWNPGDSSKSYCGIALYDYAISWHLISYNKNSKTLVVPKQFLDAYTRKKPENNNSMADVLLWEFLSINDYLLLPGGETFDIK